MKFGNSPLFVWKLVLVAVIVAAAILSILDPVAIHIKQRGQELTQAFNKEATTSASGKQKQKPKSNDSNSAQSTDFVFFGNSLLQAALPSQEDLGTMISLLAERKGHTGAITVLNLAQDGRSPLDLEQQAGKFFGLR